MKQKTFDMKQKAVWKPLAAIVVIAVLLFGTSRGLAAQEEKYAQQELDIMLHNLLPGSVTFAEEPYTGEDTNIRTVYKAENGFVIETVTAGYAGDITMLVGVSSEAKVTGVVVRQLSETFGLGANALNDVDFLAQFLNTSGEAEVGTNVDAISGATVTSKAVARSVNSAVAFVTGADVSSGATSWGG